MSGAGALVLIGIVIWTGFAALVGLFIWIVRLPGAGYGAAWDRVRRSRGRAGRPEMPGAGHRVGALGGRV